MKASELRIGNLLQSKDNEDIFTVINIRHDSIGCFCNIHLNHVQDGFFFEKYDFFNPIKLTEDWFFKFGFEKTEKGGVSYQYSIGENPVTKDYIMSLIWLKNPLNPRNTKSYPFYINGYHEIKYVHQLQNLYFALTGEELEINE